MAKQLLQPKQAEVLPLPKKKKRKNLDKLRAKVKSVLAEIGDIKVPKAKNIDKKADALGTLFDKNCLTCSLFSACTDKKKRFDYVCNKYTIFKPDKKTEPEKVYSGDIIVPRRKALLRRVEKISDATESYIKFEKLTEKALLEFQSTQLAPDIRIDDRDMPVAKNIIDFCSPKFLNTKLFAKQVEVALHTMSDYCPRCSDQKYIDCIPIEHTLDQILERVQLLEHGKCPKCKRTRTDFYNKGLMKVPVELALLCGQRCITGDSLVISNQGILRMDELVKSNKYGFHKINNSNNLLLSNEKGKLRTPSHTFKGKPEHLINIKTKAGHNIRGTIEHPLWGTDDFIKLNDIQIGQVIEYKVGQDIWPTELPSLNKYTKTANYNLANLIINNKYQVGRFRLSHYPTKMSNSIAKLLGYWVSEGSGSDKENYSRLQITQHDKEVMADIIKCYSENYSHQLMEVNETDLIVNSVSVINHFKLLLDGKLPKSDRKQIPSIVRKSPKHIMSAFLSALFEGDGSAKSDFVHYATISKILARQVQVILQNYGIVCRLVESETWTTNGSESQVVKPLYEVFIEGKVALKKFQRQIGFISTTKNKQLVELISQKNNMKLNMPYWYEKYPEFIKRQFVELLFNEIEPQLKTITSHKVRKTPLSLYTIYADGGSFKRIKANNVTLSKQRILLAFNPLIPYFNKLKPETVNKITSFIKMANDYNTIYTEVVDKYRTKKKYVTYDFTIPQGHRFIANGLLNHNSGKTAIARILLVYTYHRYLKLQNAGMVFELLEEEILTSYLIALTFAQAKTLLYDGVYNYLTTSPWFKQYHELMDHYGEKFGEELYKVKETFAMYRHRKLFIAVRGPDMRSLRGVTAFASAIDEIGLFINSKGENNQNAIKINGEEVYTSVSNAFLTLRPKYRKLLKEGNYNLPPPLLLNTSSPTSKKDMIVNLCKQGKTSPDIFSRHYATWEFNPNITRKDLQGKFTNNYAKALRDYGAVPPNSSSPFIEKMKQIKPLCSPNVINMLNYRPAIVELASGMSKMSGKVIFNKADTQIPHVLCFDAGHINNSFAIVTGYFDDKLNIPIIDGLLEVIPSSDTPISFTAMLDDIISPIIKRLNVKFVASDRWQNLKFFSDIEEEHDIETGSYSLKYPQFLQFKEDVDSVGMAMPMPEVKFNKIDELTGEDYPNSFLYKPVAHLISQMLTVQDAQKDVIKGAGLTDDLFRALVLAHSYLTDPEYQDLFIGSDLTEIQVKRALGVVGSGSGSSGSAAGSFNGIGVVASRRSG